MHVLNLHAIMCIVNVISIRRRCVSPCALSRFACSGKLRLLHCALLSLLSHSIVEVSRPSTLSSTTHQPSRGNLPRLEVFQWPPQLLLLTRGLSQHFKHRVRPWLGSEGLSVAILDEKQPERDWHRWMQALLDAVATRPMFKAELEYTVALTAVAALTALQLASDDLSVVSAAGPTLRQRRQLALRAFINNSLLEGGDARELIKGCAFASGVIGAAIRTMAQTARQGRV